MDTFLIRLSRDDHHLPAERAEEFFRWIADQPDGADAVAELHERHAVSDERKGTLLAAIRAWNTERPISEIGPEIQALQHELMRDLKIPPFDT